MNAIYIIWLRQLKRYIRSKSRIIGSLGQPILFLVALGFGFGPIYERAGNGNYIEFIGPGVVAMAIVFNAMFSGIEIIWDRQFGFLKETMVAPVSRFNIMFGRTLGGATVATFQGIIVLLISMIAGFRIANLTLLPLALLVMIMIAFMFTALGTAIASQLEDMQAFPLIMNFLVMPMFFLSGSIFPLNNLPAGIDLVTKLNPLSYGVDALHYSLLSQSQFSFLTDLSILFAVTAVLLGIGSWLFTKMEI